VKEGHKGLGVVLILGAATLWGTFGLFGKKLFSYGYTPIELASLRTSIAWAMLALLMLIQRKSVRIAWRDVPFYIVYALFAFALFALLYFETLEFTPVAVAAALIYTAPAFVLLISAATGVEPLNARRAGLLLLTLCNMFWVFGLAALALAIPEPPWSSLGPTASLPWLFGLALLPTLTAYLLYVKALEFTKATTASMLATAEPVVAALLGTLVLGEATGIDTAIGIALIVASAVLLVRE